MNEVPEVYSGPFQRRRRDMQATLMVVAHADNFAPLATPPVKPKPLNLARWLVAQGIAAGIHAHRTRPGLYGSATWAILAGYTRVNT